MAIFIGELNDRFTGHCNIDFISIYNILVGYK